MANREMLYDIIYALAARDGREAVLFGDCAPLAHEAFTRSLAGDGYFPELWFELPLASAPWFDLHALVSLGDLDPHADFTPETCGGNPDAFAWFAAQTNNVRQLALSWDTSAGDIESPAVQLLTGTGDMRATCDFLTAAGRSDAADAYRIFAGRIPEGWYACYTGVFPRRTTPFLRVECIPNEALQHAYADDADLLEAHLRLAGLTELGETILTRCQILARAPFKFELQFDVDANGCASNMLGASLRFAAPKEETSYQAFEPDGAGGALMQQVEDWGLADERWRLLADTTYAERVTFRGDSNVIFCYPAFLKLRWQDGNPLDAKTYLMAGVTD